MASAGISVSRADSWFSMNSVQHIRDFYETLIPKDFGHELLRIGGENDGGYVIPNDLTGTTYCLSPGCNLLASFELDLFRQFGIHSQICDLPEYLPKKESAGLEFIPKLLGTAGGPNFITLHQWVDHVKDRDSDELILQMDIEGAEYEILQQASSSLLQNFRIIVVEFHSLHLLKYRYFSESQIEPVFRKLLQDFDVVNINANNACGYWFYGWDKFPRIIEVTLHRKDRRKTLTPGTWDSSLNQSNVPTLKEVLFPWQ
jgi:hypothetical protein